MKPILVLCTSACRIASTILIVLFVTRPDSHEFYFQWFVIVNLWIIRGDMEIEKLDKRESSNA